MFMAKFCLILMSNSFMISAVMHLHYYLPHVFSLSNIVWNLNDVNYIYIFYFVYVGMS